MNFKIYHDYSFKELMIKKAPLPIIDYLRSKRKDLRRLKFKAKNLISPKIISEKDILYALKIINVKDGDSIFVHSAMSAFGLIKGGAETVIRCLEYAVGANGTIAMPSFPISGNTIEFIKKKNVFSVNETPSNMGAITERFRIKKDVLRSLHPTHSIAAKGRLSGKIVKDHEKSETPFNEASPFGKMIYYNFKIISFGAGLQHFTINHTFADLCKDRFPFKIYLENEYVVRCVDYYGKSVEVKTKVHDPEISRYRWDSRPKVAKKIKKILLESGKLRSAKLGRGEVFLIEAKDLINEFHKMLEKGITVYDLPVKDRGKNDE